MEVNNGYPGDFKCHLRDKMVQKIKEVKAKKQGHSRWGLSNRFTAGAEIQSGHAQVKEGADRKSSGDCDLKTGGKEVKELSEVPVRKEFWEKEPQSVARKPKRSRRVCSEAVLAKPAGGMSYATILRSFKSRVNPEELVIRVQRIRDTCSNGYLVQIRWAVKDRDRLDSAFRDIVGERGIVHHLDPMLQMEIVVLDPTTKKAVRSCLHEDPSAEVEISLTRRHFKEARKAFVELEEALTFRLLRMTHIKIGWASCRMHRRTVASRCYHCLGFGLKTA